MARLPRLVVPGHAHLLIHRGNNRQPVFIDAADQRRYLDALREVARVCNVNIHAYALLDNEVQLLVTPAAGDGLSKMMQSMGRRYVAAFNQRHGRTGTLWEGRFRATVVESDGYVLPCMVYIETSPVRAAWSATSAAAAVTSASHHLTGLPDTLIWEHPQYWALGNTPFEREAAYKLLFENGLRDEEISAIEASAQQGWPLGSDAFLSELKAATSRRLVRLKPGRPKSIQSGPN